MTLDDTRRAAAWQAQSLLLGYPDRTLLDRRPLLRRVAQSLPAAVGTPLGSVLDHLDATPPLALATDYVDTFDHRKRFSPYLTYFLYGDTRKRGMALLRFKQAYRAAGLVLDDGELPDHLAVVLEFAAAHAESGHRLLIEYRAGVELMRLGLRDAGSAWAGVLDSVVATLPPLPGGDRDAVARLIAEGPPGEEVGLEPFAPPSYMPEPIGGRR
ncbi:nitrate reductase molybdenum cofactor assembly chaperone [Nocardia blacklockiae]|uniref:nitrate reductase molybdenum cofactor assembly chaperone n=1 Tax=Nocardia blacklockiae TaxID=480036 RepID=UPI001895BF1F|nr:nitrate reductase molybdenum cofactor assembly chaperone [Nocardia blacklockiae]MBF6170794.1 nitrate reductase molybdenum cofactor assembly chaperone [Nocardia blacklockiae]